MTFKATVFGRPIVKKNTQRVVRKGGHTFVIYNQRYVEWRKSAILQLKHQLNEIQPISFKEPVNLSLKFYFENKQGQADLSNLVEGIADVLEELGVIENDKLVCSLNGTSKHFGEEARVEIEITPLAKESKDATRETTRVGP